MVYKLTTQWPWLRNWWRLEVPIIYIWSVFLGLSFKEHPHKILDMAQNMVLWRTSIGSDPVNSLNWTLKMCHSQRANVPASMWREYVKGIYNLSSWLLSSLGGAHLGLWMPIIMGKNLQEPSPKCPSQRQNGDFPSFCKRWLEGICAFYSGAAPSTFL